jgi:hypothetical protein
MGPRAYRHRAGYERKVQDQDRDQALRSRHVWRSYGLAALTAVT